jgi:Ca2+-binding RTX toxin-like protein
MTYFTGTAGDDNYTGSIGSDYFYLVQGGDDWARGGAANDSFGMGATLSSGDRLDGGLGADTVFLDGDYSSGLTVQAAMAVDMDGFYMSDGFSYDLAFADGVNQTADGMQINAVSLAAGNHLYFDGSRETTSTFNVYGGAGDDRLIGGGGVDNLHIEAGGADLAIGGGGADTFGAGDQLDRGDRLNGGHGSDILFLNGDYNLALRPNTVRFIERIDLTGGHDYRLRLHDDTVGSGETMKITAFALTGEHRLRLVGSMELDGNLLVTGGAGRDSLVGGGGEDQLSGGAGGDFLVGGDGADILRGGASHDRLTGGDGQDTFLFDDGGSSVGNPDLITDLSPFDIIDLSAIDAEAGAAGDQQFALVSHFTGAAGELEILYDSGGDVTRFLMDTDGDAIADQAIDAMGDGGGFSQFIL